MESSRKKAISFLYLLFPLLLHSSAYKTGDLIFRSGSGLISDIARNFSAHDKRFSHVGMIYIEKTKVFVIHTLDDEAKRIKHTVKEPLKSFLDDALTWKVYKLPITKKERFWLEYNIQREIKAAKPFDYHFDLQTPKTFYCTELIWSLLKDSLGRDIVPTRTIKNKQEFLSIEDILQIPNLRIYK